MTKVSAHWSELSPLLDEALELAPEARAAWIEALPPARRHLQEPLRELLLRAPGRAGPGFLEGPPRVSAPPPAAAHAPGAQVGPHRLLRELGSGGMASVWLAERADDGPARRVALKLLRWVADPEAVLRRWERERDALAALEHPHIARLYDAGLTAAGQPWLAMEYVDGLPLDRHARERGLSVRARLELFLQVAQAVAYAHSRLVVHRDLKPPNILVTADGQIRLLDFGIAKLLDDGRGGDEETSETVAGAFTPAYAAPEQVTGGAITVATDVYALGVVLFELLTGRRPFRNPGGRAGALEKAILQEAAPRLSDAAPAADRRALRGDLDTIVDLALRKDPAERYATVNDLAQDLRRHLRGEPVLAQPDSAWYRARKFLARHRLGVAAAAALLLALLGGLATTRWQARLAEAERDRAQALLARSAAVMEATDFLLHQAADQLDGATFQRLLQGAAEMSRVAHHDAPEREALVLLALASYEATVDDRTRALALLERAGELLRGSGDRDLLAQVACKQASWAYGTDGAAAALATVDGWARDRTIDPQSRVECLGAASVLAAHVEPPEVGLRHAREALATLGSVRRPSPQLRARVLYWLGEAESAAQDTGAAEAHLEEAVQVLKAAALDQSLDGLLVRTALSDLQESTGAFRKAWVHLEAVMAAFAGRTPPDALLTRWAYRLDALGRYEEAAGAYLRAAEVGQRSGNPLFAAQALAGAASALRRTGRLEEAAGRVEEAERLSRQGLAPGAPAVGTVLRTKALVRLDAGRAAEARAIADELLRPGAPPLSREARLHSLLLRSRVALAEGAVDPAREDARQALEIAVQKQAHQPASAVVGRVQLLLGQIEERAGRTAEAAAAYRAAGRHLSEAIAADQPEVRLAEAGLARLAAAGLRPRPAP